MFQDTSGTAIQLIAFGLVLAVIKDVYMFFDVYNVLDFAIFLVAGMMLGGKVPPNRNAPGVLLCLPAMVHCLLNVAMRFSACMLLQVHPRSL